MSIHGQGLPITIKKVLIYADTDVSKVLCILTYFLYHEH